MLFTLLLLVATSCGTRRTMRYTADHLSSEIESTRWQVSFDSLSGNYTEGFFLDPTTHPSLSYDIQVDEGKLIVECSQRDKKIELPHEEGVLSLEEFEEGSFYISIKGEDAQKGNLTFEWLEN